ncbi:MAG: lytic transglycosylase domain-containing protein [Cellvibrio sp.]
MAKPLLFLLMISLTVADVYAAAEATPATEKNSAAAAVDFEKQVREVAQRTAAEAKAKKEQERLARTKAATDKITASGGTALKVFKYKKDGTVMFADSAPYKTHYEVVVYNSCYACSLTSTVNWHNTRLHLTEFSDTISLASKQHGVDAGFIRAIIHAESAFNPLARSRKGAMGLMQLMPGTAKDMGVIDSTNPEQNIKGGVRYLAGLLKKFSGNEALAAAAYNAGAGAVTRYSGIPPYEETQTYVKRVKILSERYKNQKQLAAN